MRAWKNAWWQVRLERLEAAARAKDSARTFGEAQQMSRLLRPNGLTSAPIYAQPTVETSQRAQHFRSVLNVPRTFAPGVLDELPDLSAETSSIDWSPLSWAAFLQAVQRLKSGKAADSLGSGQGQGHDFWTASVAELHTMLCNFWNGHRGGTN